MSSPGDGGGESRRLRHERGGASSYSGAGVPDLSAGGSVISSAITDSRSAMAAATPGGCGTERGGTSPYSGAGVPDLSEGGRVISNAVTDSRPSLEARAASAFARAVISSPAKSSHRWASPLGGVEKRKGLERMEVIDILAKIEEMLALYEAEQCVNITVLKNFFVWPAGLNVEADEAVLHDVPVKLSVDSDGVNYISYDEEIPVAVDYTEVMYVCTQQSCNIQKGKHVVPFSDDEDAFFYHYEEEDSDGDEAPEPDYFEKKQPMRLGPTSRSRHEVVEYQSGDFIPSTDEERSPDDLGDSDDDGFVKKLTLASGNKRKLKKMKKRNCSYCKCTSSSSKSHTNSSYCQCTSSSSKSNTNSSYYSAPAAALRATPTSTTASAPAAAPRAPPARAPRAAVPQGPRPFSAPRSTEASCTTRVGRQRKMTPRMERYLNAGKHDAYKK
ncbi:hypothetical protein ACQ4PT_061934 [Festuca glaucescens]